MHQRTRWFKGWLQTWLVMMRDPAKLPVEMGVAGCISFQLLIGGMLISSLAHPWLIMFMAASIGYALSGSPEMTTFEGLLFLLDLLNLLGSYALFLLLGRVMMVREERKNVGWRWIALPVYWLMLSAAAWRAVCELPYKPFFWDKTPQMQGRSCVPPPGVRLQAATLSFYSYRSSALARN
jgi:cellulose synthase/poly-beta-1,6-N-acetylglucosamine synthase-like glycosyltransferase